MALTPEELRGRIETFLRESRTPGMLEPGEELLPLVPGGFSLDLTAAAVSLQAWDARRSLARRIVAIESEKPGRLQLTFERFGKRTGTLVLIDTTRPQSRTLAVKSHRHVFREQFRCFLRRQFCGWKIVELSAEPDLEHSLSPIYPRAYLRQGGSGWAAIAAPPDAHDPAGCLTYGLIWLDYLRRREPRITVGGLAVFVPEGRHHATALRLRWLNPNAARCALFLYDRDFHENPADPADCGNLDTELGVCRAPASLPPEYRFLAQLPGVETVPSIDGSLALRIRGLVFAVYRNGRMEAGIDRRRPISDARELAELAEGIARVRTRSAPDPHHPLYRRYPESWLESAVRANLHEVDASLLPCPLYGQVPAFTGAERGVIDLLAADGAGRLAVLELKAAEDPHLPFQALDYWMRVAWHARRGEFAARGYFPAQALLPRPPRLYLVSPALLFHPSAASILRYFHPEIEVCRVGLGIEWQRKLTVVFRASGAESPMWASHQDGENAESNSA